MNILNVYSFMLSFIFIDFIFFFSLYFLFTHQNHDNPIEVYKELYWHINICGKYIFFRE